MKKPHVFTLNDPGTSAKLGAEAHDMKVIMKASMELGTCPFRLLIPRLGA